MILKMVIDISMLSLCKFSVNITKNIKLWELLLKKKKKIEHLEQKDLTNYKWFSSKGRRKKVVVLGDGGWWGGGLFHFRIIYLFILFNDHDRGCFHAKIMAKYYFHELPEFHESLN